MQIVIRTDASIEIGTGHVMRCLSLAEGLAESGAKLQFICREHAGNLINLIEQHGFNVSSLATTSEQNIGIETNSLDHSDWLGCDWKVDANLCRKLIKRKVDWIIVDHYALDHYWETSLRDKCHHILCIDDLANRKHDCDLLLDQNLGRNIDDYHDLIPDHAIQLLGPKHALLRPEFAKWRDVSLLRRQKPELRHILVSMGGVDKDNLTGRILKTLRNCNVSSQEVITVVLGPHTPWYEQLKILASKMPVKTSVLTAVDNMAELLASCDLAIGAGGTTTWERCSLGVPTIQIELAKNQRFINTAMANARAALVFDLFYLEQQLSMFFRNDYLSNCLKDLSSRTANITDGHGVKKNVRIFS